MYYVNDSDGDTFIFNETIDDVSQARPRSMSPRELHHRQADIAQEGEDDSLGLRRQALPRQHAPHEKPSPNRDHLQLQVTDR